MSYLHVKISLSSYIVFTNISQGKKEHSVVLIRFNHLDCAFVYDLGCNSFIHSFLQPTFGHLQFAGTGNAIIAKTGLPPS